MLATLRTRLPRRGRARPARCSRRRLRLQRSPTRRRPSLFQFLPPRARRALGLQRLRAGVEMAANGPAKISKFRELLIHVVQPDREQVADLATSIPARSALIDDKLPNIFEGQAESLCLLDKLHPLNHLIAVRPEPARRPMSARKHTETLVVAQRVD